MRKYDIAIVGATGLVGRTFQKVLTERNFPIDNITFYASERSAGTTLNFLGKDYTVVELKEENIHKFDFALFSAGGTISKEFAPIFAANGTIVIDNSSAWRMNEECPLVVPEVNPEDLEWHRGIIANPNCSTIQLLLPLKAIMRDFGLKKVVVSTYQSISGAGQKGLDQLYAEMSGDFSKTSKHQIYSNTMFHAVDENEQDWTNEEIKMIKESRKMLHDPDLDITVTCVRLPLQIGHAETVYIETNKELQRNQILESLLSMENLIVQDELNTETYPTPMQTAHLDEVFVGRIRKDLNNPHAFWMWVVANNIRKGAATNAVQIAEKMIEMKLL
ncbi:MAG: aspartate-semialdehyde dehydrogenase [Ignavibacteria bacterium GWF2_33_9]|nr:MAG: aspartate-semialdehyde dehydrogenase [Ignavibacteria bacterium GWF2_33_9]